MLLSESQCQYPYICCLIYLDHLDSLGALAKLWSVTLHRYPMYVPSFDHFCIWKANHSLIDCQLSGNRIAEAVGVVVLGTGVSAETFRWVKLYHGLDRWVAAWQDTLHAIAFILRRNRQTAPMGVGSSMLWMLLAGGACITAWHDSICKPWGEHIPPRAWHECTGRAVWGMCGWHLILWSIQNQRHRCCLQCKHVLYTNIYCI